MIVFSLIISLMKEFNIDDSLTPRLMLIISNCFVFPLSNLNFSYYGLLPWSIREVIALHPSYFHNAQKFYPLAVDDDPHLSFRLRNFKSIQNILSLFAYEDLAAEIIQKHKCL